MLSDKKQALQRYGEYSMKLARLLKEGAKLDVDEQTFIENHLVMVQLALAMSKYGTAERKPQ